MAATLSLSWSATSSTSGTLTWTISGLGSAFNTTSYKLAGIAKSAVTSGATSVSNSVTTKSATSSGTSTTVSGTVTLNKSSYSAGTYTFYGYTQSANSKYYPAGSASVKIFYPGSAGFCACSNRIIMYTSDSADRHYIRNGSNTTIHNSTSLVNDHWSSSTSSTISRTTTYYYNYYPDGTSSWAYGTAPSFAFSSGGGSTTLRATTTNNACLYADDVTKNSCTIYMRGWAWYPSSASMNVYVSVYSGSTLVKSTTSTLKTLTNSGWSVTGLSGGTSYSIYAYAGAARDYDTLWLMGQGTFTTDAVPSPSVTTASQSSSTATSISVDWSVSNSSTMTAQAVQYKLSTASSYSTQTVSGTSTRSATITGLSTGVTYDVRIRVYDGSSYYYSTAVSVTMLPQAYMGVAYCLNKVVIATAADSYVTNHYLGTSASSYSNRVNATSFTTAGSKYWSITTPSSSLSSGTTYYPGYRVNNMVTWHGYSFTVGSGITTQANAFEVTSTSTTVTVKMVGWGFDYTSSSYTKPNVRLMVGDSSSGAISWTSAESGYTFTGLTGGETYTVKAYFDTPNFEIFSKSITLPVGRPTNFAWTNTHGSGYACTTLTAAEWNELRAKVNEFRTYKGLSSATMTAATQGGTFTYTMFNQVRNAIYDMNTSGCPATVSKGDSVIWGNIDKLRTCLNAIT